jgi:hypothetical protein
VKKIDIALPMNAHYELFNYTYPACVKREHVDAIRANLRPDDVFVASWPKSGTNWVKQIVNSIRFRGSLPKEKEDQDLGHMIPWAEGEGAKLDFAALDRVLPRAFHTHLPFSDLPKGSRIIYVIRDFQHIPPSYLKFVKPMGGFPSHDANDVARMLMDGHLSYGPWEQHVAGFWAQRRNPSVLLVKYEDLKTDLSGQVARIARFLKVALTKTEFENAVSMCTFKYMKAREAKMQGKEYLESVLGTTFADDFTTINKGDAETSALTPETKEALSKHFVKVAPLLGNPASYADFNVNTFNAVADKTCCDERSE